MHSFALTPDSSCYANMVVVKPRAVAPHRIVLPDRDQFYALDEGQAGRNADRLHVVVNLGQGNRTALAVPMGDGGTHRRDRAPINVAHGPHEASRCAGDKHQYLCRAGDISRHIRRNLHIGTSRCHLATLAYFSSSTCHWQQCTHEHRHCDQCESEYCMAPSPCSMDERTRISIADAALD